MDYSAAQILFLNFLPGVGNSTFWQIVNQYPRFNDLLSDKALIAKLPEKAVPDIVKLQEQGDQCPLMQRAFAELDLVEQTGVSLLTYRDPEYPSLLKEISSSPPMLYVRGDISMLSFPQIAMVGSRNTSSNGRQTAESFSSELAANGFVITSGLALGIDASAHKGAIKAGGKTIGVIGTGIDRVYPARNARLFEDIVSSGGAIVSEFPLGTEAVPHNFPRRNRTISGLSCGTLVVEAALKSGSLITARYALEQNREVFAIPGSIHNPLSRGCNSLIKSGAKLVERAEDILEELSGMMAYQWENLGIQRSTVKPALPKAVLTEAEEKVYEQVGFDYIGSDDILNNLDLPIGDVMAHLMSLELKGRIALEGPGYIRLI